MRLSGLSEQSFVIKGFTNWKDATRVFVKHESCDFHKQAVAALANKEDIGEILSKQPALEKDKSDLDRQQLQAPLPLLLSLIQEAQKSEERGLTIHNIVIVLSELSTPQQLAFSQVFVTMKLLLVMPVTNACSERSFSALRRLKTHLRATMSQQCLNNLLVLHVHKSETDLLKLAEVGNEFVSVREQRLCMFGRFE